MTGRIRGRCCGLMVVRSSEVQVIHKYMLDFLTEDDVWRTAFSVTPSFDPDAGLIAACLLTVKSRALAPQTMFNNAVLNCLRYCQLKEKATGRAQTQVMNELRRVLAAQAPNDLPKLMQKARLDGLLRYVHYRSQDGGVEEMRGIDIPSMVVRIVEGITEASMEISKHCAGFLIIF